LGAGDTLLPRSGRARYCRSAAREAVASLEHAIAALGHTPESRVKADLAIDLRFEIHGALIQVGEMERALRELETAAALARSIGDRIRGARASTLMAFPLVHLGLTERAVEAGRQGLGTASELGDLPLEIAARYRLGAALYFHGSLAESIGVLRPAIATLEAQEMNLERFDLHILASVATRIFLAWSLAERGDFREATRAAEDAIKVASGTAHAYSVSAGWMHLGWVQLIQSRFDDSVASLEQGFEIARAGGFRFLIALHSPQLGAAYKFTDRTAEAFAVLDTGLQESRALRLHLSEAWNRLRRAEVLLACGRFEEAAEEGHNAMESSRGFRLSGLAAETLLLLGNLRAAADPPAVLDAERSYSEALALGAEIGLRPLVAHCHFGLGKLYGRTNKLDRAREHLATATTMYREMDMPFWLGRAEAEGGGQRSP
jgi:tetratricopeptide (TPR) repeat protein